eukprot:TRINITY_DN1772_c0_g1_i1.p1 TRINITY_DN1772_c0_g1~~TRINITY_DN1772_c0_g1_i1.p1  ORF type:complete len:275 (-),score=119.69 TRINITY_DN1772_c0_g1_i1:43-867(-)
MNRAFSGAAGKLAMASIFFGVAGFIGQSCLFNVDGGHRAVIMDQFSGIKQEVKKEGTHFIIPFVQKPYIFDVRMRPRLISTITSTKDIQQVTVALRVLSRPDENKLPAIFKDLGVDYDERVLPSIGNEVLKQVIAQYDAESLLTLREKVSREIRDSMNRRAAEFNVKLDDVSLVHLAFSKEFTQAIEKKQVAQQDAERSKFIVMKSEQERQAAVIQAEGEAKAADLISKTINEVGSGLLEIRRLEAAKDIADAFSRSKNVTYLPGSGTNVLMKV